MTAAATVTRPATVKATFVVGRHNSELGIGVEWGTNFEFPDTGCWELSVSAPKNTGMIVLAVQ